jgi:DNA modification methylase
VELNHIHFGDTVEFMKSIPNNSVNLIVADPPYNIDKDFGPGTIFTDNETWVNWSRVWLSEAKRVLHEQGNIFVYAIHHNVCYLQCLMLELGFEYRRQIIWFYENGWSRYKNGPACHYEPLLWFSKSPSSYYLTIREPYKSTERLKHKITKNGKTWTPHPEGKQAGDVWNFPTLSGKRFANERVAHPTQKPLSITYRIIEHFSQTGDTVLVPFVGSGTECLAAFQLGRDYIGAEINKDYYNIALNRLQNAQILLT